MNLLRRQYRRRHSVFYWLLIGAFFTIVNSNTAQAYDNNYIENNLDYGISRAAGWDADCRKYLSDRQTFGGSLRTIINGGNDGSASYRGLSWLSERTKPNVVSPTFVDYGQKSVDLQINSVMFICGALVVPDSYGASPTAPANPEAGKVVNQAERWVTNGNANDRSPNSIGSTNLRPAQVDSKTTILGFEVLEGGGYVTGAGQELRTSRNDSTRYWFSQKRDVNYINNDGITSDKYLKVKMKYKQINAYGATSGSSRIEQCAKPGGGNATATGRDSLQYSSCAENETILNILIKPRSNDPPPRGVVDNYTCNLVRGWAFDESKSSQSIDVHIYIDGVFQGVKSANEYSGEASAGGGGDVNGHYNINGQHRFTYNWPSGINKSVGHSVEVYAIGIDANGATNGQNTKIGTGTFGGSSCGPPPDTNFPYCEPGATTNSFAISGTGPTDAKSGGSVGVTISLDGRSIARVSGNYTYQMTAAQIRSIVDGESHTLSAQSDSYIYYHQPAFDHIHTSTDKKGKVTTSTHRHPEVNRYRSDNLGSKTTGKCYNFKLTPQTDPLNSTLEAGDSVDVRSSVTNAKFDSSLPHTKSPSRTRHLTRIIYSPDAANSAGSQTKKDNSSADACGAFSGANRDSCTIVRNNSLSFGTSPSTTTTPTYRYTVPDDIEVGSLVCFALSVSRPDSSTSAPDWRHSALMCSRVAKRPKMQVQGGDIRVGGNIQTSSRIVNGKAYGSWVEYGAFAVGNSNGFASGAGFNGGNSSTPSDNWTKLTFANVTNNGSASYGNYAFTSRAQALVDQFVTPDGSANFSGSNVNSLGSGIYTAGNLSLSATTLNPGKSIIINASGTVTITGDIKYSDGNYTRLKDLPQLVIIAQNIKINDTVDRIDAWLTTGASGYIDTCANKPVRLTSKICNNRLTVNGPVVTDSLILRRTAGSDDANRSGDPAEVFNLRADALLWAQQYALEGGKAQTVYSSELPPRF